MMVSGRGMCGARLREGRAGPGRCGVLSPAIGLKLCQAGCTVALDPM